MKVQVFRNFKNPEDLIDVVILYKQDEYVGQFNFTTAKCFLQKDSNGNDYLALPIDKINL